jgi:hypothetical protein
MRCIIDTVGDYETWKYTAPIRKAACLRKTLRIRYEFGSGAGKHGIFKLIVMGVIAHTSAVVTVGEISVWANERTF